MLFLASRSIGMHFGYRKYVLPEIFTEIKVVQSGSD
jgi:hypothetical protein